MAHTTEKLYNVADLAALAGTSAPQLGMWRLRWTTFPKPSFTNQKGLSPLWTEHDKDTILELVEKHYALKAESAAL